MKISTYIPVYQKSFFEHENPFDIFVANLILEFLQMNHQIVRHDEAADVNLIFNQIGEVREDTPNILIVGDSFIPFLFLKKYQDRLLEKFKKIDSIIYRSKAARDAFHKNIGKKKNEWIILGGISHDHILNPPYVNFQKPNGEIITSDYDMWLYAGHLYPGSGLRESILYFVENSLENSIMIVLGEPESVRWETLKPLVDEFGEDMDSKIIQLAAASEISVISAIKQCNKFVNLSQFLYSYDLFCTAAIFNRHIICAESAVREDIFGNNCTVLKKDGQVLYRKERDIEESALKNLLIKSVAKEYFDKILFTIKG